MFARWYARTLAKRLQRPYVHLVFGARQTGKSTLVRSLSPPDALVIDLSDPAERTRHLAAPGEFVGMCRALPRRRGRSFVFVDEVQLVPGILDAVQHLYDSDKKRWTFVLCGSSARKLRRTGANLLPGRSMLHRIVPLVLAEHPAPTQSTPAVPSPLPLSWEGAFRSESLFPAWDLDARLAWGALPGIVAARDRDRADLLKAYAVVHLEEEIRREALVKDWGAFVRFLTLAAAESGQIVNYTGISNETGISQPTVKSYYQLLEDMFVGFSVPAFSKSPRKNLLSTPKFFFFDPGVRHAASGVRPSKNVVRANPGRYLEEWVGAELWKRLTYLGEGGLFHFRTKDGAEIDFVVVQGRRVIPIEVKYTEHPTAKDARHLSQFLVEQGNRAPRGYVICRVSRPVEIAPRVVALPWHCL